MSTEQRAVSTAIAMPAAADQPVRKDPAAEVAPTPPDQTSGNAVPAPLAKEDELRADDVMQSAEELKVATERSHKEQGT
jgi:hypothetical protein